jgi:RimJ/RimL family protein N-acetyltransferase
MLPCGDPGIPEHRSAGVETGRLRLLRPRLSDVPVLFRFLGDPRAMRFTHCDASLRACRRRIVMHEWFRRRDGCAPWTVVRRDDGRIIGWGGLYHDPFDRGWGIEVGYHFDPRAWGQGYATELVAACTMIADRDLRIPALVAFAHPDNQGSQRVLQRSGFRQQRYVVEMNRFLYRRTPGW